MNNKKEFYKWYKIGCDAVLEYLEKIKGLNLREEFNLFENCDEYINYRGEEIKNY